MTYREHLPRPELRRFVDRFWTSAATEAGGPRRVLPDGCIDVLVLLDDVAHPILVRRMFRAHVGVGPITFARVARLHRAVGRLQQDGGESLAGAAAALGYFDEAHMARDFRDLAGTTAGTARASRGSIFPIPALLDESLSRP